MKSIDEYLEILHNQIKMSISATVRQEVIGQWQTNAMLEEKIKELIQEKRQLKEILTVISNSVKLPSEVAEKVRKLL